MNEQPMGNFHVERAPRSLTSATYRHLKEDILACTLRPGERLKILELSVAYHCSPGAVREALTRLVAEELVVAEDQRGFRVAPVSRTDLLDLTQTRIDIEGAAIRHAIAKGGGHYRAGVITATEELMKESMVDTSGSITARWHELHQSFHMALVAGCESPRLLRLCLAFYRQSQRFRMLTFRYHARGIHAHEEHQALSDAVVAQNAELAVQLLADHYNKTTDLIIEVDRTGDRPILDSQR